MTLEKFLQEQKLQHKRPNTIKNHKTVLEYLDKFKPLDECTADDVKAYVEKYIKDFELKHGRKPEKGNINYLYSSFKKYYKWLGKPEVVGWIKIKIVLKKINPNKLLTPAEIQNMLRVWEKDRDKCLLAMAYEGGFRISELLSLRVEDIKVNDGECKVRIPDNDEGEDINSKTGSRSLVLIESMPYIEKWLNVHNGGESLFGLKKVRAHEILKMMASKAGITKNVHWHLLRHTRATEMAKLGMQETAMKKRFGWQEDSAMIKRYTSLTDDDADDSYKTALGLSSKKKNVTVNPIAKRCSKCGKIIESGEYCEQCLEIERLSKANQKATMDNQQLRQEMDDMKQEQYEAQMKLLEMMKRTIKGESIDDLLEEDD